MESPASANDLETAARRIADPNIGLKVKYDVACELRDQIDSVRDTEIFRVFNNVAMTVLNNLRDGEPSFKKDALEYQYRRVLMEILYRLPHAEPSRQHVPVIMSVLLHLLRTDNEENGVTCIRIIIDLLRSFKGLSDEQVSEIISVFQDLLVNVRDLVPEYLSNDSAPADANTVFPSAKSFKVLTEAPILLVLFFQAYKHVVQAQIQIIVPAALEMLMLESPAQKSAREDKEAMGDFWAGTAPSIINTQIYQDFIGAQIKMISFVAFVMKANQDLLAAGGGDKVALACVRLLQDCPNHHASGRRELLVVLRHLISTSSRIALVPSMDKLFTESILLGPSVGSQEALRHIAYSAIADLVHQLRNELTVEQLTRAVHRYSCLLQNPYVAIGMQTMCAKMMFATVEVIVARESPENGIRILQALLFTCVDRLAALVNTYEEVAARASRPKQVEAAYDQTDIEKERPFASAAYAAENSVEYLRDCRFLFRTILHGFRLCQANLKKREGPSLDGDIMHEFFISCVRCMHFYEPEPREQEKEAMDWFAGVLIDMNPHVFQEIWTRNLGFFFDNCIKHINLLHIANLLLTNAETSPALNAIVLRHFVDRLDAMGDEDDLTASATIKFFKMAFNAVGYFPEPNEPVLASHLGRLIMDSFPMAAKAAHPMNYFQLMRALFRAIGSGAGRYELLYKEVLPLLPEMLDSLNRQLLAADAQTRDLLVELCLTVPLRLTHLLPHLHYLMQPLVHALQGGPELVSQGLRTLELCIDNLTGEFLDPILKPVLRELMEALHSHLKPLPASHHHAHTTIRILGKLGGRNRRLLDENPHMTYHQFGETAKVLVSFTGRPESIRFGPMVLLAADILKKSDSPYREYAYKFLEQALTVLLNDGLQGRDRENIFTEGLKGLFDAIFIPDLQERAEALIRTLSRHILTLEVRRALTKDSASLRFPSHTFGLFLEALPHAFARLDLQQAKRGKVIVASLVHDLVLIGRTNGLSPQDIFPALHQIAGRFSALCFDETWIRRRAGCTGVMIMATTPEVGEKWTKDREYDLVRTLLHVLKDLPHDPPRGVSDIVDILTHVIRVTNRAKPMAEAGSPNNQSKVPFLIAIFFNELSSPHPVVRQAAQSCIELLAKLSDVSIVQLLAPHRERVLTSIYVKPLRALPFPVQIGQVEAVRYCVSLEPPLPEPNDELMRLLHEALALADAEDSTLINRNNIRQSSIEADQLRVACIKLLTASMALTDYFAKNPPTRQRVISVYFKSLYSNSKAIKDVAHEGLRTVLGHQSRLPRDLLQTGLRPILMNLADPKRLTVSGLDGLARLLELLTNYFKVEIGQKLLDHFKIIADAQMLHLSARTPLPDNDGITKLVHLVNIFHLLPSAANVFMEGLVEVVVRVEEQLQITVESPFSKPLGKFLDRYPAESLDHFLHKMDQHRHIRTLRNILQAHLAPKFLQELASRPDDLIAIFQQWEPNASLSALLLCVDLSNLVPGWCGANPKLIDALLRHWNEIPYTELESVNPISIKQCSLLVTLFLKVLEDTSRIDVLFDLMTVYTRNMALDVTRVTKFLYNHVAATGSTLYRRNIMARFLTWFEDISVPWASKTYFLRYVLTPTILLHSQRVQDDAILDRGILKGFHDKLWRRMIDESGLVGADDLLKVELLHLVTVMVHHCPDLLMEAKKDIIKCAWAYITSEDSVVKQTAYLLASRFFEAYETPPKFILTAWTGLLRPPHTESRPLVKQALDILAPVLQKRMSQEGSSAPWAKSTRRLLAEESHGLQHLIIIYQLIARHPDIFYPCRSLFIPHMVNSLSRIGIGTSSTAESKVLSLEVIHTLFRWEQTATTEQDASLAWLTALGFRETVVSYLVRFATTNHDPQLRGTLVPRSLALLREVLSSPGWNDVSFKLDYFRKTLDLTDINDNTLSQAIAAARVLNVVAADKSDEWYQQNAMVLQKLVQKGISSENAGLHESLHPIVDKLLQLYPLPKEEEDSQSEMTEFFSFVYKTINEGLSSGPNYRVTLQILHSVVKVNPERIEAFAAPLMRLLTKFTKDHVASTPKQAGYDDIVRLIVSISEITEPCLAYMGDQKRWFMGTLLVLVEKTSSVMLCRHMLGIARFWAMHKREPYPTMKDKANWLVKMVAFEDRTELIFAEYLELIYDIYTEPSLRRSELTTRLEHPFLLGCRARDHTIRERFIDLLDGSIPRSLTSRLSYILGVQTWEALSDSNWIYLALDLLLSCVDGDDLLIANVNVSFTQTASTLAQSMSTSRARDFIKPLRRLLYLDAHKAQETWVSVFSAVWSRLSRKEQTDMTHHMVTLLSREHHIRQCELRPNVIQALLEGVHACSPPMSLPPHLLKYLAKTFGAWHVVLELLQDSIDHLREDDNQVRDCILDSLAEVYAELAEEDMFYGLWRWRSLHAETNVAVSFEQIGMWQEAQLAYETAQNRSRNGTIAFYEPEYCLWEDHWILSAEKLQQWDLLYDLARNDMSHELMLESAWRTKDWSEKEVRESLEEQIQQLSEIATPRRRVFEAFMALVKMPPGVEKNTDFIRILEDAMQLSLRKWVCLPERMSTAHIPLLQHFQQFVELQESVQIFSSLSVTTHQNLEKKSSELKMILQAWRERLPNLHDDISVWSDLVAWRQNIFNAINKQYIPLIQTNGQAAPASNVSNTFGYRGYHETAWIINRFAHVARKHDLLEVSHTSLKKIYELPNIEISEAFLKLREEARCHHQVNDELQQGLDLINNTNLMYFSSAQKSEFYTLKGMFYSRLSRNEEANACFSQAVSLDMGLGKAWAEWGRYSDRMFKDNPEDLSHAANAVSCYLQAAGIYKNAKSRPLLTRVLWLLSIDDQTFTISRAFDTYKGEVAYWYWITLIPQLCSSLQHREVKQVRYILLNLAKHHPQALFFPLRTTKEDLAAVKKQTAEAMSARAQQLHPSQYAQSASGAVQHPDSTWLANGGIMKSEEAVPVGLQANGSSSQMSVDSANDGASGEGTSNQQVVKHPWEIVDEIVSILKTAYPLLALNLETMVDQLSQRFRSSPEEEIYRFTYMLLQDGVQTYSARVSAPNDDGALPDTTLKNIVRLANSLAGQARKDYEEDFINSKPNLQDYIRRLQHWRDRYEKYLDSRPRLQPLDLLSHWLTEFQYSKVDEVEIPGQYLEHVDNNSQFSRIQQFGPKFEICRGQGYCFKRLFIIGHDSSKHTFAVQVPAGRFIRREERVLQLFRTLSFALTRRKESRKRNLHFHLPVAVSVSPGVRLVANDSSYVTLQEIYEQHCEKIGISREDPVLVAGEKCKAVYKEAGMPMSNRSELINMKKTILDEVTLKMVPDDVLHRYMVGTMDSPAELWRMRKHFTAQLAAVSFMTYVLAITSRQPARFHICRRTGEIHMSELIPGFSTHPSGVPMFHTNESVPFRFTPNLQRFVGPVGTEGILMSGIVSIARAVTNPEFDLDQQLCLFSRDEVFTWFHTRGKTCNTADVAFRNHVGLNIEGVVKKAELMACRQERTQQDARNGERQLPAMQTVTQLISIATNPLKLALMADSYSPWY